MAISTRDVLVVVRARDVASRIVRQVGTSFNRAGEEAQRSAHKMMNAGAALTGLGVGMGVVGASILSYLRTVALEAATYDQLAQRTRSQVDDLSISTEMLGAMARRIALDIPKPAEELQRTLFYIFSTMDVNYSQAEHLLRNFAKESVASMADIESAARTTIAILNAFQSPVSEVSRVTDVQFQIIRKGAITYEELSRTLGLALPATVRAGQSFETLGAMLAFLTKQGLTASRATTSSARALESFAHPRTVRKLEDMGIVVRDSHGEFLPLVDVIEQLNHSMRNMPAPDRAEAMFELFKGSGGRIQARRFWDLVIQNFSEFRKMVNYMEGAEGIFDRVYKEMLERPQSQLQLLTNSWQELRYVLGNDVLPLMMPLVNHFRDMIVQLSMMDDATRRSRVQWAAYTGVFFVVGGAVATLAGMLLMLEAATKLAFGIGPIGYIVKNLNWLRTAIGVTALDFGKIMKASVVSSGVVKGSVLGLRTTVVAAFKAMGTALKTFVLAHPVLTVIALIIGGLAIAYKRLTARSKEIAEATAEYTQALWLQKDVITQSVDTLDHYKGLMAEAARETVINRLAEEDLLDVLRRSSDVRSHEFVSAILDENNSRQEVLRTLQAEQEALERNTRTIAGSTGIREVMTIAAREQHGNIDTLIDTLEREAQAVDAAKEAFLDRLAAQGPLGEAQAEYIRLLDAGTERASIEAQLRAIRIKQMLDEAIAAGTATDAQMELAEAYGHLPDHLSEASEAAKELSETVKNLGSVLGDLLSPTKTFQDALASLNEGLEEPKDTLIEFGDKGMKAWITAMQEGESKTTELFGNMVTVMLRSSNEMDQSAEDVIGSLLAMGEAGPEAMAMLANASPEDFLEALRLIRLHAAMTNEDVIASIGGLITEFETLMIDNADMPADYFQAMLENAVLMIQSEGHEIADSMGDIWVDTAAAIGATEGLTREQVGIVMAAIAEVAEGGGALATRRFLAQLASGQADIPGIFAEYDAAIKRGATAIRPPNIEVPVVLNTSMFNTAAVRNALRAINVPSINVPINITGNLNTAAVRNALRMNTGGLIPGRGPNRDSVLMAATRGEYVLRRQSVDSIGVNRLDDINARGAKALQGEGTSIQSTEATYNYMPNAQVTVQDSSDVEVEIKKFEQWIRSRRP